MGASDRCNVEEKAPTMRRELSVDDLFGPLNRLDVRPESSSAPPPSGSAIASSSPLPAASLPSGCLPLSGSASSKPGNHAAPTVPTRSPLYAQSQAPGPQSIQATCAQPQDRGSCTPLSFPGQFSLDQNSALNFPLVSSVIGATNCSGIDRERFNDFGTSGGWSTAAQSGSTPANPVMSYSRFDEPGSGSSSQNEKGPVSKSNETERPRPSSLKGSGGVKSPVSGSDTGLHPQCNSTSDEDQHVLDDRKQRRMLSNRESARRSRLRKQQHLDELRTHVAQLRAENSQMLSRFNLASQHYAQLTEENKVLRSEAMDLSHQLQRLHHTVTAQYSNGLRGYGLDSGQVTQGSLRAESGRLPPLS